jgi:hypothetical protein
MPKTPSVMGVGAVTLIISMPVTVVSGHEVRSWNPNGDRTVTTVSGPIGAAAIIVAGTELSDTATNAATDPVRNIVRSILRPVRGMGAALLVACRTVRRRNVERVS